MRHRAHRGSMVGAFRLKRLEGWSRERFCIVKDYGAAGNGRGDDTAAIQRALDSEAAHVHISHGVYRISDAKQDGTPALRSKQPGRRITCDGIITATTPVLVALEIVGACSDVQVNIAGNDHIAWGVSVRAGYCAVHDCRISDLHTKTFSGVAIGSTALPGPVTIRDNIIRRIVAEGDSKLGNGRGMSRAILVSFTGPASGESIVEGNVIEDVLGEEGDAIAVIAYDGEQFRDAHTIVRGNAIRNFTRRGVKVQAGRVCIEGNRFTHDFTSAPPNAATVIDLVQGGNVMAARNYLDSCKWFRQFSAWSAVGESYSNIWIDDNRIWGIGAETSAGVILVQPRGSNAFIRRNDIACGTGRAIAAGDLSGLLVEGNNIWAADNAAERVVTLASTVTGGVVRGNTLFTGARRSFIGNDNAGNVMLDNRALNDTLVYAS